MSAITEMQETANVRALTDAEVESINGGIWQFIAGYIAGKLLDYVIDNVHNPDTGPGPVPGGAWSASRLYWPKLAEANTHVAPPLSGR
jgi:hypothetical protein